MPKYNGDTEKLFAHPATIGKKLFETIREIVPDGATILELGSGAGTGLLAGFYKMHSVEHNEEWVGRYDSNYIHAPIVDGWYDRIVLKDKLPPTYDAWLIDGPPGNIGRMGLIDNFGLFRINIPIFFDDLHREDDMRVYNELMRIMGNPHHKIISEVDKSFGVINYGW